MWKKQIQPGEKVPLKLAAADGAAVEEVYALMAGMKREDFRSMMLSGGRPPEGNLYRSDWEDE